MPTDPMTKSIHIALREHFGCKILEAFTSLTGHRLHVLWHGPDEFSDPAAPPVLCPTARAWLGSGHRLSGVCARCQRDNWQPFNPDISHGRRFQGSCGAECFRSGLRVGRMLPVTLALRADSPSAGFDQAVQLLGLVLSGAQATLAAIMNHHKPEEGGQVPQPRQHGMTSPPPPLPAATGHPRSHAVVSRMLELIHSNYQHPFTLAEVAADLKMNSNYLSSLFSATVGVTFHHYLDDLRLTRAIKLLRDPSWRICEVAAATGFSSPCHFDNFFKTRMGVPPSIWREAEATGERDLDPPASLRAAPEKS